MAQDRTGDVLEALLRSVDRPGDFCAHGRLLAPMPLLEVQGAGVLSFPVPEAQVRALIAAAERAPYGKGPETLVDRSVRDCWQIGPQRIRLAGAAWPKTFADILGSAAAGLGCAPGRLDAQLHKLLIYEPGGFFSAHRDTEKADGMVATLSISLPAAGAGGELVVRHGGRESTFDMTAGEPSELAFAAFYADCAHEVRPVTAGHRLSLVFNLCLRAGDTSTPRDAPDHGGRVDEVAKRLAAWGSARGAVDKLVWLLDHEYSEAGLSFDALKNVDAARARVLAAAAERAECELHAASVHIREYGPAEYSGSFDGWGPDDDDAEDEEADAGDWEMGEVYDREEWLDGWADPAGRRPPFGEVALLPDELLPRGALDGERPDEQRVHEASGNEGVSIERAYRRAALVLWPRSKTLAIVASASIEGAVAWVEEQLDRNDGVAGPRIRELAAKVTDHWPSREVEEEEGSQGRVRMLALLPAIGDKRETARFLHEVVLSRYDGRENDALPASLDLIGPQAARRFLLDLAVAQLRRRPADVLALLWRLAEARGEAAGPARDGVLRAVVRAILLALPAALLPARRRETPAPGSRPAERFGDRAVARLFVLAWRAGLVREAADAARAVVAEPRTVTPDRTLPAALAELRREEGAAASEAFALLWRHASDSLLARSAGPPAEPSDWTIAANVGCRCEHCQRLRAFCKDPAARTARFPLRKDLRAHLHQIIDRRGLDVEHVTERRGRPFTLVCTKTRASHQRRLAEYAEDVACMRRLLAAAPAGAQARHCEPDLARLQEAVTASGRA